MNKKTRPRTRWEKDQTAARVGRPAREHARARRRTHLPAQVFGFCELLLQQTRQYGPDARTAASNVATMTVTAAELRANPDDSGYPGPNGPMPPEEFAVLVGCPKDKDCQAWCRDGDRSQCQVLLALPGRGRALLGPGFSEVRPRRRRAEERVTRPRIADAVAPGRHRRSLWWTGRLRRPAGARPENDSPRDVRAHRLTGEALPLTISIPPSGKNI